MGQINFKRHFKIFHTEILINYTNEENEKVQSLLTSIGVSKFFRKGSESNILSFADHIISITTIEFYCCITKAAIDNK